MGPDFSAKRDRLHKTSGKIVCLTYPPSSLILLRIHTVACTISSAVGLSCLATVLHLLSLRKQNYSSLNNRLKNECVNCDVCKHSCFLSLQIYSHTLGCRWNKRVLCIHRIKCIVELHRINQNQWKLNKNHNFRDQLTKWEFCNIYYSAYVCSLCIWNFLSYNIRTRGVVL